MSAAKAGAASEDGPGCRFAPSGLRSYETTSISPTRLRVGFTVIRTSWPRRLRNSISRPTENWPQGCATAPNVTLRRRPGRAKREPGPIRRSLSRGHGVWVPAFAGTTANSPLPRLLLRIGVHQRADHALIGHAPRLRRPLEVIDRPARQRQRHLHVLLARHQRF